ncbi:rod shape-determining protein MreD [Candidatus Pelagibacter sp.]|nr:rod shape-determining protein MreD [Candidatus Pelagibacter sp.]
MITIKNKIRYFLHKNTPVLLLFISVLNEIDFNNLGLKYFSFNFVYILIFHYNLKRDGGIGYVSVFIAGLFNDVINGIPMGISSLCYLLLCVFAAYLRNITLRPSLIKDCITFLISILVLNTITFTYLFWFYGYEINYLNQVVNTIFTFLLFFIFSNLFKVYDEVILGQLK